MRIETIYRNRYFARFSSKIEAPYDGKLQIIVLSLIIDTLSLDVRIIWRRALNLFSRFKRDFLRFTRLKRGMRR